MSQSLLLLACGRLVQLSTLPLCVLNCRTTDVTAPHIFLNEDVAHVISDNMTSYKRLKSAVAATLALASLTLMPQAFAQDDQILYTPEFGITAQEWDDMMLYFENGGTIQQLTPTGLSNLRSQPNAGGYASPDFVGLVSYAVSRCAMNATCANAVAKVST